MFRSFIHHKSVNHGIFRNGGDGLLSACVESEESKQNRPETPSSEEETAGNRETIKLFMSGGAAFQYLYKLDAYLRLKYSIYPEALQAAT